MGPARREDAAMEEACRHGLAIGECAICGDERRVFVTAGGNHYHWFRDCEAISTGQTEAALRGDHLHPIERTLLVDADAQGRAECRTCRDRKREG